MGWLRGSDNGLTILSRVLSDTYLDLHPACQRNRFAKVERPSTGLVRAVLGCRLVYDKIYALSKYVRLSRRDHSRT